MMHFLRASLLLAASVGALPQPQPVKVGSGIPSEAFQPRQKREFRVRTDAPISAKANKVVTVVVGGPQDYFIPNSVQADVGDVVQFQFSNGNHTVTQAAQDTPCQPLEGGVHSGHVPYDAGQTTVGTFNMPVLSTDPMFLYCATGPHCLEGQVMVVNPADNEQVVTFAKTAQSQAENVDAGTVIGGTVGSIPLEAAAFVPAAEEEQGPPPDAAAPEEDPAATSEAAEGGLVIETLTGTVTTTVTVPAATAGAAAPTA